MSEWPSQLFFGTMPNDFPTDIADFESLNGRLLFAIPKKGEHVRRVLIFSEKVTLLFQVGFMRNAWNSWQVRLGSRTSIPFARDVRQVPTSNSGDTID